MESNSEKNKNGAKSLIKGYTLRTMVLALTSLIIVFLLKIPEKLQMGVFIFSLSFVLFVFKDLLQESLPIKSKIFLGAMVDVIIISAAYFALGINRQFYILLFLTIAISLTMFLPRKKKV
ncbi:MAG: hypothetical protein GX046_03345 [Tissierellia bacterium]|jgi:hypothetical protein|nr:hypothetical protein [Tissierellia bacterium]